MHDCTEMLIKSPAQQMELSSTQVVSREAGALLTRKIWLPRLLYDALPWFYLLSGVTALVTTLYISGWFWILPHYAIFAAACIHLGLVIYRRRIRRSQTEE